MNNLIMIRARSAYAAGIATALALTLGCRGTVQPGSHQPQEQPVKPIVTTGPVRIGVSPPTKAAAEIVFNQEEPWRSVDARFHTHLDFNQPVIQTEAALSSYGPDVAYMGEKDWSKMVLELWCSSDDRTPGVPAKPGDGPLAALVAVQVFAADRGQPIAAFSRADLKLERGTANSFEHDARGPIVLTVERVRLPFATHAQLVHAGHPYRLTVVGFDAQGQTMICDTIEGDEHIQAIRPQPLPQSGWAPAIRSNDPTELKAKIDAQVGAAWAKLQTTQDIHGANAVTWSPQLSPALPGNWPPAGDGELVFDVYALGQRAGLRDGALVAAPWTRVHVSGAGEVTLDPSTEFKDLGIQGIKPMSASTAQALVHAESSIAIIVRGRTMPAGSSLRDAYRDWLKKNGVIAPSVKARSPPFFAWLDADTQP